MLCTCLLLFVNYATSESRAKQTYDSMVRSTLQNFVSGRSEFEFYEVIVYWTRDGRAYHYVSYRVTFEDLSEDTYIIKDCHTGLFIREGLEFLHSDMLEDYLDVCKKCPAPIIYSSQEIDEIIMPYL